MRFFANKIHNEMALLDGDEFRHAVNVMRVKPGDDVEVFDGRGTVALGRIGGIGKHDLQIAITKKTVIPPRWAGRVILAVSIAKGERFDSLITGCTEIGVDRICPVLFERTVKQASGAKVLDRYNRLALAAVKQCGRAYLPEINDPLSLAAAILLLQSDYPECYMLFGAFGPETSSVLEIDTQKDVIAFVGPEGGLSPDEEKLLVASRALPVKITSTVLRIETAAMAFAAILCAKRDRLKV
jgi:16S rRNA (uracil1498-N3)-methyltransferase